MAKRGFFAELNHQAQLAERRRLQQQAGLQRAQTAIAREAERARVQSERAAAAAQRASAANKKEAERAAMLAHRESRAAEVAQMNAELQERYAAVDTLLASTLAVDDFVDLESLKITKVEHPPFEPGALGTPTPEMPPLVYPAEPPYVEPTAPTGLAGAFGGKKKHEEAVNRARAAHQAQHQAWVAYCQNLHADYTAELQRRATAEAQRLERLAEARAAYDEECRTREAQAAAQNEQLTKFINDLAFDVESAIAEYVGVVLANSVYPESFPVTYDHTFDLATRELRLTVTVPEPEAVPTIKEYKYVASKDEVTSTSLPVKEQKDRYANAVWQVALRTLHEVFEADRAAKIRSIALTVGAEHIAPATGRHESVPLAVVAADRDTFLSFELANVVPHATLLHLGAALSKSPLDLTPADTSAGVRKHGS